MSTKDKGTKRLEEHLSEAMRESNIAGYLFIASNGSVNYDLVIESSDIDSKLVSIPTLEDLVFKSRGEKSITHSMSDNGEHVDIKDVYSMFSMFKKQNMNFLELMFAEYYIVNPVYKSYFDKLLEHKEEIARYDQVAAVNCTVGHMRQKLSYLENHLDKKDHQFDKNYHNILRLHYYLVKYVNGLPYKQCISSWTPKQKEKLISIKTGDYDREEAIEESKKIIEMSDSIRSDFISNGVDKNLDISTFLDNLTLEIIKESVKANTFKNHT